MKRMFFFQLKKVAWRKAIITTKQRDCLKEVNVLPSIKREEFNEKSVKFLEILMSPAQIY